MSTIIYTFSRLCAFSTWSSTTRFSLLGSCVTGSKATWSKTNSGLVPVNSSIELSIEITRFTSHLQAHRAGSSPFT